MVITAASVWDLVVARPLLWNLRHTCGIRLVWAEFGYIGRLAVCAAALG